jgi:RsiW-degrading membrane proteinase PrsW (M82 family)
MNRAQFDSQRRRAFRTMAVVLIVEIVALTAIYLTSAERMRSFYLVLGLILLGISVASGVGLMLLYQQVSKKIDKDETKATPP